MSMGNSNSGAFASIIKTIFILLGVYVVAINITLWATSSNTGMVQADDLLGEWCVFGAYHSSRMKDFGYVGFESFFNTLSTFPGLKYTQGVVMNNWLDIVSNYNVTNIGLLDFVLAIVRIFTAPVLMLVTIVTDVFNNVLWFLGFLNIIPNTPQGTFLS